ncbi:MAG: SDR family oxidoreductase [Bacteroidales bacterium]
MNIIVTGASRGIGYELVKWFAKQGKHNILALSRNKKNLGLLKQEAGQAGRAYMDYFPFDVSGNQYDEVLLPWVRSHMGTVDILINNAGSLLPEKVEKTTDSAFDSQFDVNIKGPFKMVRALHAYFSENAHIVNITSMGGYQGSVKFPGLGIYSASKGALSIFTEALAEEWKERKIFVNALALGAVQTEMLEEAFPDMEVDKKPSEMAAYIGSFALSGHQFYNGKVLPVTNSTP